MAFTLWISAAQIITRRRQWAGDSASHAVIWRYDVAGFSDLAGSAESQPPGLPGGLPGRWVLQAHRILPAAFLLRGEALYAINSHALQTHTLYKANAPPAIVSIHGITPAYFHCLHATLARRAQARAALRPRVLGTGQLHFLCNLESPVRT